MHLIGIISYGIFIINGWKVTEKGGKYKSKISTYYSGCTNYRKFEVMPINYHIQRKNRQNDKTI